MHGTGATTFPSGILRLIKSGESPSLLTNFEIVQVKINASRRLESFGLKRKLANFSQRLVFFLRDPATILLSPFYLFPPSSSPRKIIFLAQLKQLNVYIYPRRAQRAAFRTNLDVLTVMSTCVRQFASGALVFLRRVRTRCIMHDRGVKYEKERIGRASCRRREMHERMAFIFLEEDNRI